MSCMMIPPEIFYPRGRKINHFKAFPIFPKKTFDFFVIHDTIGIQFSREAKKIWRYISWLIRLVTIAFPAVHVQKPAQFPQLLRVIPITKSTLMLASTAVHVQRLAQ